MFSDFDRERRRIEGALHDGVQQDLAAVSVAVQLALQLLDTDPGQARALLAELEPQVQAALERVRALAAETYPSVLPARGLGAALGTTDVGRYPLEIEEAVYFACRALAGPVRLWADGGLLRFEVAGAGDEDAIAHARARVASVGGQLDVSPGSVAAAIPVSPSAR